MTTNDTPCMNCGAKTPCGCTEPMPQADTNQARYGQRHVSKMIREVEQLRRAIRAHDNEATEAAWDRVEQHIDYPYRAMPGNVPQDDASVWMLTALLADQQRGDLIEALEWIEKNGDCRGESVEVIRTVLRDVSGGSRLSPKAYLITGPWENDPDGTNPGIYMDDPGGGDPLIIASIKRIYREDALLVALRAGAPILNKDSTLPAVQVTDAARDVLAERKRQISAEGWTLEHDEVHVDGELVQAAISYAMTGKGSDHALTGGSWWPDEWSSRWWKPTTPRRDLVKAGALILAEIERLDRAALNPTEGAEG